MTRRKPAESTIVVYLRTRAIYLRRSLLSLFWLASLHCDTSLMGQVGGIKIVSPSDGTVVSPGQSVTVTIAAQGGTVIEKATAWILPLDHIPSAIERQPFQLPVVVPSGQIGTLTLVASASDSQGNTYQDSLEIVVKPTAPAASIRVSPNPVRFSSANGQVTSISVIASFQNGTTGYVTNSPDTKYVASNPNVVIVNSSGQAQGTAPGTSNLVVTYAGFTATVPVTVGIFPLKGDLNGDGAVDQNDIQILLGALNTASTVSGIPETLTMMDESKDRMAKYLEHSVLGRVAQLRLWTPHHQLLFRKSRAGWVTTDGTPAT